MKRYGWLLILGIVLGSGAAWTGAEPVRITAASVSGDAEKKITYLEGSVRIVQGKTIITTEYMAINTEQKTAVLDKGTRLENPDVIIESRRLQYNLKQKSGTFREQVFLKRIESGKAAQDPFELTASELYFETDTKNFKASGNSRLLHKQFEGQAQRIEYDDAGQKLDFKGNTVILQDATVIKTEAVTIDLSKKQLQLKTNVDLTSREIRVAAEGLTYDYDQKTGTFSGEAVLIRSEVKDGRRKVSKEPFTLKAAGLYFETGTNNFRTGNGRIEHREFTGTADKIVYDDKRQLLTFISNARLTHAEGEELNGEHIEINLRDRSFTVWHNGSVKLKIREER